MVLLHRDQRSLHNGSCASFGAKLGPQTQAPLGCRRRPRGIVLPSVGLVFPFNSLLVKKRWGEPSREPGDSLMHCGELWSSWQGQVWWPLGQPGVLSPLLEARGGKCPYGLHSQGWQSSPEHRHLRQRPAPTAGLGKGPGRGHSCCSIPAPAQGRCPRTLGRARPSLPGWVAIVSPCDHWEWAVPIRCAWQLCTGEPLPSPATAGLSGGYAVLSPSPRWVRLRKALAC